jgi:hypothetical protein
MIQITVKYFTENAVAKNVALQISKDATGNEVMRLLKSKGVTFPPQAQLRSQMNHRRLGRDQTIEEVDIEFYQIFKWSAREKYLFYFIAILYYIV